MCNERVRVSIRIAFYKSFLSMHELLKYLDMITIDMDCTKVIKSDFLHQEIW